jgi:plasmid stabilization system protein ParE
VKVRVAPEAKADIAEARRWYRERGADLDRRFLDAVEAALAAIGEHPGRGRVIDAGIRRLLIRGFSYSIFYTVDDNEAVALACLHGARSPRVWLRRRSP